jgi:uncharacterized protein (DUF2141 family)
MKLCWGGALSGFILACALTGAATQASAQSLPSPWINADIGAPTLSGSTTSPSAGSFNVTGAGRDIWDTSDQFQFVYQQVQGDVQIVARVMNVQATDPWSKAGLMIRESLAADAPHVSMLATAANPWTFLWRSVSGGTSFSTKGTNTQVPGWLKLTRIGTTITGYYSPDGTTWTQLDSEPLTGTTLYIGLVVTSHNVNARATDAFTNVSVTALSGNQVPTVSLTSPSNGATFTAPATISLAANANDADGSIAKVDFYQGSTLIGTDTTSPYSFTWSNVAAGTYSLTARATDNAGGVGTSATVSVTVNSSTNAPPSVSITSPTPGASFTAPANITIQASASDTDGTISKVDFYQGSTLLGTDTTSPYSFTWSNVPAGSYSLTARATDNGNSVQTSSAVTVTVSTATNQLPTVSITSPTSGASYPAPGSVTIDATASDSDGTIVGVDFYQGSTLIGTDTTSPYSATWSNVPAGTYSLTAVARDNAGGSKTSSAVSITVTGGGLAPWTSADVGSPALSGSASSPSPGSFSVTGAGADIWANADQFQFVYQQIQGDTQIVARVTAIQNTDPWSKGGLMMRESLGGNAAHASIFGAAANPWHFVWRPSTNGQTTSTKAANTVLPGWLKLTRVGNTITGYTSTDGTTWTLLDSKVVTMPSTIYVGLVVTSHNANARATDTFTNVAITPISTTNQPPTVAITSPASGASFGAPASITINANASDSDGSIASVDFYNGSQLISSDTSSPYSATWTNVPAGTYSVTAVARDNSGATTTSSPVSITVSGSTQKINLVFTVGPDHDTAVSSYIIAVYRASDPVTASPVATSDIGKPTPVNGDITVDISPLVNPLPSGSYKVVVRATGPGGTTDSAPSPTFTK